MPTKKKHTDAEPLEPLIFTVRGHRVMLDADLARLYGVGTKVLNQAVKRNASRFPQDFAFQLTVEDFLRWSQFATTSLQGAEAKTNISNRSQFVTG